MKPLQNPRSHGTEGTACSSLGVVSFRQLTGQWAINRPMRLNLVSKSGSRTVGLFFNGGYDFSVNQAAPLTSERVSLTLRHRLISLVEVFLGAFLVIGHNVLRIVPNEVPILFALFWISLRVRDGGWSVAGLRRPKSWRRIVIMAFVGALVLQLGSEFVIQPLARQFWHQPEHVSSLLRTANLGWRIALRDLLVVWTFAAFGEETGYRGYLVARAADLGNRSQLVYIVAIVYVAVLFGIGHFYKGATGVIDSTYSGLVLGAVYLLADRNLWASILTHGISDTIAVFVVFMGWAN